MQRQLYVTSKKFKEGRILIGILTEIATDDYRFEYKLDGKAQQWHLPLREFPDVTKTYEGADVERFINRVVPRRDSVNIKLALESANLTEYDTWEMLKVYGLRNMKDDAFLFENLPEGVVMYEQVALPV